MSYSRELSLPDPWVRYHGAHLLMQATEDCRAHGLCGAALSSTPPNTDAGDQGLMTIADEKSKLRKVALATRRDAHGKAGKGAGEVLADRFLAAKEIILPEPGAVLAGYWPVGSEIDTRPLMRRLHGAGYALALPVVEGDGNPLIFRRWRPGDALVPGGHGTHAPKPEAERSIPGVVLVPLLAFDARGGRLGRGGGHYDRTLEGLRREGDVLVLGMAYAAQRVASAPQDGFDQKLDWIVTEDGVIRGRS